jgi:hypothetical protein
MHPNRWLAVLVAAGVAACGGDKTTDAPTAPEFRPTRAGCDFPTLSQAVRGYFADSLDTRLTQMVTDAKNLKDTDAAAADLVLYQLLDSLSKYHDQDTPEEASTVAYQDLLCTTGGASGLSATSFVAAFDETGAFAPVGYTSTDAKTVESHDGRWVLHPPDDETWANISSREPLVIYGAPIDITEANYTLDPPLLSNIFNWQSFPSGVTFDPKVIVGNCEQTAPGTTPPDAAYIQHNAVVNNAVNSGPAELLDFVHPKCASALFRSTRVGLGQRIWNFFAPATAYAAFFLPTSGGQKGALSPDAAVTVDALEFAFQSQPNTKQNKVGTPLFGKDGKPLTVIASSDGGTKFMQTQVFGWLEATNNQGSFVAICHNWVYSNENGEFVFDEAVLNKAGGYVVTFKSPGTFQDKSAPNAPEVDPVGFVTTNLFNVKNGTVSNCPDGSTYTGTVDGPFPSPPQQ